MKRNAIPVLDDNSKRFVKRCMPPGENHFYVDMTNLGLFEFKVKI